MPRSVRSSRYSSSSASTPSRSRSPRTRRVYSPQSPLYSPASPRYSRSRSRSRSRERRQSHYCIGEKCGHSSHKNKNNLVEFADNVGDLFEQKLFTDCSIIAADGTKFEVHKNILSCRSPVFRAMFSHEMVEAKEGIVKIENIKPPVLEQMLRFIYSGSLQMSKLGKMAMELLEAAVEYQLDALKVLCEEELCDSIGNENVCELLVLANRYSAHNLKDKAVSHIRKHTKKVMETEGYKMFVKGNHGELFDQILKAFV